MTIQEIFKKHHVDLKSNLEVLHKDLIFLKNAINLVVGQSKAGKTFTTISCLVEKGFKDSVIHLDFDRNADEKLKSLGVETYHINEPTEFLQELSNSDNISNVIDSLADKILVIDSLQDLSLGDGLDSNSGSLETMKRVQGFKDTGATIILIHHVTLDSENKMKVKGNQSVITSKCDTTITFTKTNSKSRKMTVYNTRAEDKIPSNTSIEFNDSKITTKGSNNVPK